MDFRPLYFHLFNAATDAINEIELGRYHVAKDILIQAQIKGEDMYIESVADENDDELETQAEQAVEKYLRLIESGKL